MVDLSTNIAIYILYQRIDDFKFMYHNAVQAAHVHENQASNNPGKGKNQFDKKDNNEDSYSNNQASQMWYATWRHKN